MKKLPAFPFSPRQWLRAGRQWHSNQADICLIWYAETLLELGTGRHYQLERAGDATHLAETARQLLPAVDAKPHLTLCLPPEEFIATPVHLPGVSGQNLRNALRLQLPMLLPGSTAPLLLAVSAQTHPDGRYIAFWMSASRADALFDAFKQVGLSLTALLPRPLVLLDDKPALSQLYDEDPHGLTAVTVQAGHVLRWLHLPRQDCEDPTFFEQFKARVQADHGPTPPLTRQLNSLAAWEQQAPPSAVAYQYALIPVQAAQQQAQWQRRRRWQWLQMAAGGLVALLLIALLLLWRHEQRVSDELTKLREVTHDISALRQEVFDIEDKIGPVALFPEQEVTQLLTQLDSLLPKTAWLTRLKVEGGLIELEGYTLDPGAILEALTKNPAFSHVGFNRQIDSRGGIGGAERFGIAMQWVGIDVKAYLEQYFPNAPKK